MIIDRPRPVRAGLVLGLALVALVAPGCAGRPEAPGRPAFELTILHSSDNESGFVDPVTLEPRLLHYAALVAGLRALAPGGGRQAIHVTAGDHTLPGPLYQAAAEVPALGARGLADIAFFNAMGLTANGIGNHEFDGGIDDFARMLAAARYPFIAVNLDFGPVRLKPGTPPIRAGRDAGSVAENAGRVVKSAWVEVAGQRIGLIGRAPADFFNVIFRPEQTVPGLDFVGGREPATGQPRVSALGQVLEQVTLLQAQGIDKIVLLDHAQDFTGDPLSTQHLTGIDVVVTAGSTGFTARREATGPFNRLRPGDRALGEYPVRRTDRDGHPVLVVNSEQLYRYVGHLVVGFDRAGHVVSVDPRSGPVATTAEAVAEVGRLAGRELAPPPEVTALFATLTRTPLVAGLMQVVGQTRVGLNGERADARTRETNLGRVVADAMLWRGRVRDPRVVAAVMNGGGLRGSIPAPQITGFTVAQALAFDNPHAIVEVTAAGLLAALENGVSRVPAADGRFPQVAGLVLEYDPARPGLSDQPRLTTPSRVRTLRVRRADGTEDAIVTAGALVGDPERPFVVVTNDFLAGGGDGYRAFRAGDPGAPRVTPLPDRAQRVFTAYVQEALGRQVDVADPAVPPRVVRLGP